MPFASRKGFGAARSNQSLESTYESGDGDPTEVKRVLMTSGKIYYELVIERLGDPMLGQRVQLLHADDRDVVAVLLLLAR